MRAAVFLALWTAACTLQPVGTYQHLSIPLVPSRAALAALLTSISAPVHQIWCTIRTTQSITTCNSIINSSHFTSRQSDQHLKLGQVQDPLRSGPFLARLQSSVTLPPNQLLTDCQAQSRTEITAPPTVTATAAAAATTTTIIITTTTLRPLLLAAFTTLRGATAPRLHAAQQQRHQPRAAWSARQPWPRRPITTDRLVITRACRQISGGHQLPASLTRNRTCPRRQRPQQLQASTSGRATTTSTQTRQPVWPRPRQTVRPASRLHTRDQYYKTCLS